jgi:large subunit ribosomal protein L13
MTRKWYLLDASKQPFGRLASQAATLLIGKSKPSYAPNVDGGDYVVVINSDKLVATGKKLDDKKYYRHSQYPGSLKEFTLQEKIDKDSTEVIELAVARMLPTNKLKAGRLKRLKIFPTAEHGHTAQQPEEIGGDKE